MRVRKYCDEVSLTTIVAWVRKLLGVPIVKIYEKRCSDCGHEFEVFRKYPPDAFKSSVNTMGRKRDHQLRGWWCVIKLSKMV